MKEHSENFNKDIENIRKYQTEVIELKNKWTKINTLEQFNSGPDDKEVKINDL